MPPLSLNGEWLKVQATATHLGHTIGSSSSNNNNTTKTTTTNNNICFKASRSIVWRKKYVMSKIGFGNSDM